MKKTLVLLLLAVLLPSVVLGWLALRDAAMQQIVLERRTAELYQKETEGVAASARTLVEEQRRAFAASVHRLLSGGNAREVAGGFTSALQKDWTQPAVGFALDREGRLLCPTARDASAHRECQQFLWDNGAFIGNKTLATVYPVQANELSRTEQAFRNKQVMPVQQSPIMGKWASSQVPMMEKTATPSPFAEGQSLESTRELAAHGPNQQVTPPIPESGLLVMKDAPSVEDKSPGDSQAVNSPRNVIPQQSAFASPSPDPPASLLTSATADFRQLTAQGGEGVINRFVQDRLNMIFWVRPPETPDFVFGCLVQAADLREIWSAALPAASPRASAGDPSGFVLALLDDKAHAVATQPANAKVADWKHPFVASEIGEELPHWEAALYLTHPEQIAESARKIRSRLVLLIAAALTAVACGGGLVVADIRRQLVLAQKKTDFVSNVSHELKTPLTSIRMFAELMHDGRAEPARQSQYLRIIMVEAERLTRLIDNVLDFARLDRQDRLEMQAVDLHGVVAGVWEGQELHLRENGFSTKWDAAPGPYPILGNADSLAQVLVNLLSNAEKYSGRQKEIALESCIEDGRVRLSVLDRGSGVPAGQESKIFQPFYRAHDSLASGVQGAGLGLTLAQRLVHAHHGTIVYRPRQGGGSCFTIDLPLAERSEAIN